MIEILIPTVVFLAILELLYFRVAKYYNIVDKPNNRSSHSEVTIRGGGIIFPIAIIAWWVFYGFQFPFFVLGLTLLSVVSFIDDIYDLKRRIRLILQLASVILLFKEWELFTAYWILIPIAVIFVIATINAYNFMDGINGMLGIYSLATIGSLWYIDTYIVDFADNQFVQICIAALLVFNLFNFRKKAMCFAGDVGSVGMAFIVVFLIGKLVITTENLAYILLLLVYGIDTAITMFFRFLRKEKIVEAHRSHFYQYLVNQQKVDHRIVALIYGVVQLGVNTIIIAFVDKQIFLLALFLGVTLFYICIRFVLEGAALFRPANKDLNTI